MSLKRGEAVPDAAVRIMTRSGPAEIQSSAIFSGRSIILFGMPGAFTPSCHYLHLPGIVEEHEMFLADGVDIVACTAVNDPFVLQAWAGQSGCGDKILLLADGNADFARALGLVLDGSALGLGLRSKRYALWAVDGIVRDLAIEPDPTKAEVSSAHAMFQSFSSWEHGTVHA